MTSPAEKAAAIGLIGVTISWGIFTAWMIGRTYAGMSGEEFAWMLALPVPVLFMPLFLGPIAGLLSISFYVKSIKIKGLLIAVAVALQIIVPNWVAKIDFSDDGSSSPIGPFWMGSVCIWLLAIAAHAFIVTQAESSDYEGDEGSD